MILREISDKNTNVVTLTMNKADWAWLEKLIAQAETAVKVDPPPYNQTRPLYACRVMSVEEGIIMWDEVERRLTAIETTLGLIADDGK